MALKAVTVPKWGLAMEEGKVTAWYVAEGDRVQAGQELVDVETAKIANTVEAPAAGQVGRIVAEVDRIVKVGGLLAVLCEGPAEDAELDAFVAGFAPEADEASAEALPAPEYIDAAGQRIRVLQAGDLKSEQIPLLLLHGFYGDLESWMFLRDRLPAGRRVVSIDLPGHGGSTKDVGEGTIGHLGSTVLAVMDTLGLTQAHLVGHSMGGAIALHLAGTAPGRVASVVAIAAAGFGGPVSREFVHGMLQARRARDFRAPAEMLFADPALVTRDLLEDLARVKRVDGVQAALEKIAAAALFATDTDSLGARARGPVLAIIAEQDRVVGAPVALPDGMEILRLNVGHMAHMEAAADVARAIGGFLEHQN